jgi:hypothetical protein
MSTEESSEVPVYLNQAAVARRLGVGRAAIVNYMKRFPEEAPKPVAHLERGEIGGSDPVPLWSLEQMPEWLEFRMRRSGKELRTLVTSLSDQAEASGYGSVEEMLQALTTSSRSGSSTTDPEPQPDA